MGNLEIWRHGNLAVVKYGGGSMRARSLIEDLSQIDIILAGCCENAAVCDIILAGCCYNVAVYEEGLLCKGNA